MTVTPGEDNESVEELPPPGHPAWQEILEVIPDNLHPLVTPKLQEWDTKVKGQLEELNKYDAYKPLVEHDVPLDTIQQALYLAQQFENQPDVVVRNAINAFGLQGVLEEYAKEQGFVNNDDEDDDVEYDENDPLAGLESHPLFKQLQEKAQQIEEWEQQQQLSQQEQEAEAQLDAYLEELHENHGEFDDYYVTALLANGMDAEEAINQFQSLVKTQAEKLAGTLNPGQQREQPPVVMGGAGNAGSGLPEQTTRLGDMNKSSIADLAEQFIKNAQSQQT